jgi:hypothetical protein
MSKDQTDEALSIIITLLKSIDAKLGEFSKNNKITINSPKESTQLKSTADIMTLLTLPSSLRKTAMALYKFKKANAIELSNETGRVRSIESNFANQLVRLNFAQKKRVGKVVYFFIESEVEEK